jgi:diguanylate cyclase (GGDEF)-like protein
MVSMTDVTATNKLNVPFLRQRPISATALYKWLSAKISIIIIICCGLIIFHYLFSSEDAHLSDTNWSEPSIGSTFLILLLTLGLVYKKKFKYKKNIIIFNILLINISIATIYIHSFYIDWHSGYIHPGDLGWNVSLMIIFYAISYISYLINKTKLSQIFAMVGFIIPMISITGYIYGEYYLHGNMSIYTTILGYLCFMLLLSLTANRWAVKAILSLNSGGRIARMQLIFGWFFTFGFGRLVHQPDTNISSNSFVEFVVFSCCLLSIIAVFSAVYYQKLDVQRNLLQKKLEYEAAYDYLTQVANRRYFIAESKKMLSVLERERMPASILMLDIDNFKQINDIYGHDIGDLVLKNVADCLTKNRRLSDCVGRFGGEEFVVFLPKSTIHDAQTIAESIRHNISKIQTFDWKSGDWITVTLSIGLSHSADCHQSLEQLLIDADIALYQAKVEGKNRCCCSTT